MPAFSSVSYASQPVAAAADVPPPKPRVKVRHRSDKISLEKAERAADSMAICNPAELQAEAPSPTAV